MDKNEDLAIDQDQGAHWGAPTLDQMDQDYPMSVPCLWLKYIPFVRTIGLDRSIAIADGLLCVDILLS